MTDPEARMIGRITQLTTENEALRMRADTTLSPELLQQIAILRGEIEGKNVVIKQLKAQVAERDAEIARLREAITASQAVLARYIVPDSGISERAVVNDLLGILDHRDLVDLMRRAALSAPPQPVEDETPSLQGAAWAALDYLTLAYNERWVEGQESGTIIADLRTALMNNAAPPQQAGSETGPSQAALDVLAERRRQVVAEGFDAQHDDLHTEAQLAEAACNYAAAAVLTAKLEGETYAAGPPFDNWARVTWPWDPGWWKPGETRRMLVKAGALIVAEIERLDRAASAGARDGGQP